MVEDASRLTTAKPQLTAFQFASIKLLDSSTLRSAMCPPLDLIPTTFKTADYSTIFILMIFATAPRFVGASSNVLNCWWVFGFLCKGFFFAKKNSALLENVYGKQISIYMEMWQQWYFEDRHFGSISLAKFANLHHLSVKMRSIKSIWCRFSWPHCFPMAATHFSVGNCIISKYITLLWHNKPTA